MKTKWVLVSLLLSIAHAESDKITLPPDAPPNASAPEANSAPAQQPISTTVTDPSDKRWKEYDNRIVKSHFRVNSAWTMMELKETSQSGTVSFTLSRIPLVTFAVVRDILQGDFDAYVSSEALTPLYPTGYRKSNAVFIGRKCIEVRGIVEDGRRDESYFCSDGHSFYQVSFSAPKEAWKDAEPKFDSLKQSFRWLK